MHSPNFLPAEHFAYGFFAKENATPAPFSIDWLAALAWHAWVENPQLHPLEQKPADFLFICLVFNFRAHLLHIPPKSFHRFTAGQSHQREKTDKYGNQIGFHLQFLFSCCYTRSSEAELAKAYPPEQGACLIVKFLAPAANRPFTAEFTFNGQKNPQKITTGLGDFCKLL
jgi:hypothetical protein